MIDIGNVGQINPGYGTANTDEAGINCEHDACSLDCSYSGVSSEYETQETTSISDDGPVTWGTDLNEAMAQAKAEGKQVFVVFGRPACGNCTRTENNANNSPEARALMNENYIVVHVNIDENRDQFNPYRKGLGDSVKLPVTCVIDPANPGTATATTTSTLKEDGLISLLETGIEGKPSPNGSSYNGSGYAAAANDAFSVANATSYDFTDILGNMTNDVLTEILDGFKAASTVNTSDGEVSDDEISMDIIAPANTAPANSS